MTTVVAGHASSPSDDLLQAGLTKNTASLDERADDFMDCSTEDESLPCEIVAETNDVAIESVSGTAEQASTLTRSVSQENAYMHVQRVLQRLEQYQRCVPELKDEVASLHAALEQDSREHLEQQVTSMLKKARNVGEDLLEDLLGLDKLTGLLPDDRTSRKEAVKRMNLFLDEVDTAKSIVVKIQNTVREAREARVAQDLATLEAKKCETTESNMQTIETPLEPAPASFDRTAVAPPSSDIWTHMQVSVDFQTRQQRDGYTVLAAIPSLRRDSLQIERDERTRELTVSGVCLPTSRQIEQMHQHALAKIQRLGRPQQWNEINAHGNDVARQLYRKLGAGKFGRFSETFRLPMDVDIARISAQFNDSILSISLPQSQRRNYNVMTDPLYRRYQR